MSKPSDKLLAKFLFPFLCHPEFLSLDQRKMATLSGISNGSVSYILRYLETRALLLSLRARTKILDKAGLVELWDRSFREGLLPKLSKRRFRFQRILQSTSNGEPLALSGASWSGQTAALHYGIDFKRTEDEIIYSDQGESLRKLIIQLRLIPDPTGPLEVRERFWSFDHDKNFVPKLLAYSDLRASSDMRLAKLAEQLLR